MAWIKGATVYVGGEFLAEDLTISDSKIVPCGSVSVSPEDCSGLFVFPGFVDVHVHLREPGFLYKETIKTGTAACARGGYTTVCAMPNLNPVPDSLEHLRPQLDAIEKDACIRVLPYGSITVGQLGETLSDMETLAPYVCGFTDDGRGVQSAPLTEEAMKRAKDLGKLLVAHCEDNSLLRGGYIHDGEYARAHGHKGICSESEWGPIARDLDLAAKTGCSYHVCHISAKESVDIIRQAKKSGIDVTCETGPHYLLMDDSMLQEDGRFKMNPPIRSRDDRDALVEGLQDGTIDRVATDHAPHSFEEKSKGLAGSMMGVVGIETAFPLLYTYLVKPGIITLEHLMKVLHDNPCKRFGVGGNLLPGQPADFTVFDLNASYIIDPDEFLSKGRATPFQGWQVYGRCKKTVCGGTVVYEENK